MDLDHFLRIINSIGKQIKYDDISTDKKLYYTVLETEIFDGELDNGEEGCTIVGVEKPTNGRELKYLIKSKIKNVPECHYLIDSSVLRRTYPEMIIEFYEKLITWH